MTTNTMQDWLRQNYETGQWFRVLIRGGGDYAHQVEIPLTPRVLTAKLWERIGGVYIIRTDVRLATTKDKSIWTHHLPEDVYEKMVKGLGSARTDFLFNGNLYPIIDWNKFASNDCNGCPLKYCRRDFEGRFEQTYMQGAGIVGNITNELTFRSTNAIHATPDMVVLGGVRTEIPDNHLLIYGYYHITTGYICFDLNCSTDGQMHTSKFSQRLKPNWQKDLVAFIENMKAKGDITEGTEASIKNMVWVANNNLMAFNINRL